MDSFNEIETTLMEKSVHGINLQLKALYGALFAIVIAISVIFYLDKDQFAEKSCRSFLKKQIQTK